MKKKTVYYNDPSVYKWIYNRIKIMEATSKC